MLIRVKLILHNSLLSLSNYIISILKTEMIQIHHNFKMNIL